MLTNAFSKRRRRSSGDLRLFVYYGDGPGSNPDKKLHAGQVLNLDIGIKRKIK